MKWRLTLLVGALLVWVGPSATAYHLSGPRWASGNIVMHLQQGSSAGSLIDGSRDWNAVTESALAIWNSHIGQVSLQVVRDSNQTIAFRNNVNNVAWADDIDGEPFGDAVAVTRWLYFTSSNRITEADVIFDRSRSWNSYRGNVRNGSDGQTLYDLRRVAIHEFGHALGLGHPDEHGQSVQAIMNSRVSNTDTVQGDDIDGARALYGPPVAAPLVRDTLTAEGRLTGGQQLVSGNARYRLVYQGDGNLVLYDDSSGAAIWATGTNAGSSGYLLMQGDGNIVIYDGSGTARWSSGTADNPGSRLVVQNDGNVVLYRPDGVPAWDRHRAASPSPSPAPAPGPGPAPPPAPGTVALTGVVATPGGSRISGASVRVLDGPNAGRAASTNAAGEYRLDGLTPGNANLSATAGGHTEHRAGTFINGTNTLNFTLAPQGGTVSETLSGSVSGGHAVCPGSSIGNKPCQRHTFAVTTSGVATARLSWSNVQNDLDLELWRGSTRVASSDGVTAQELVTASVTAGAYEWRVVYYGGPTEQAYTLAVTRPN